MCGIVAVISKGDKPIINKPSIDRLSRRGPDAKGEREIQLSWGKVFLGMTRLKIVDDSDLKVPYHFKSVGISLAFNGEIYNWQDLRSQFFCGLEYETRCDAEIIARAYRKLGRHCLDLFNGMFAFVLVDHLEESVFIARDRAGEKPLYHISDDGDYYFASEIKAFSQPLEESYCDDYLALEFDTQGKTLFENVEHVRPGSYFLHEGSHSFHDQWWKLPEERKDPSNYNKMIEEATGLISDAIRIRIPGDLSFAVQVSGGLDSAIIQQVARTEHVYCVAFDEDKNNYWLASEACQNDAFVERVSFSYGDMIAALSQVAYALDTPATWTAICQFFMNKKIKDDGIKVVLTGEGADEIAGGYSRYRILHWLDEMKKDPHLEEYQGLIKKTVSEDSNILARMLNRGGSSFTHEIAYNIVDGFRGDSLLESMMRIDFNYTMQVLLRMADRMSAWWGMENRAPFLDYRLIEFFYSVPLRHLVNGVESKSLLRDVARALGVSKTIINEKTKKGLSIPQSWAPRGEKWDRSWYTKLSYDQWRSQFFFQKKEVING